MRISDWSSDVCSSDLAGGSDLPHPASRIAAVTDTIRKQFFIAHPRKRSRPNRPRVGINTALMTGTLRRRAIAGGGHRLLAGEPSDLPCSRKSMDLFEPSLDRKSTRLKSSH